jgi:FkbM family methyltransferase
MLDSKSINSQGLREYNSIVNEDLYKLKSLVGKNINYIIDIGANIGVFSRYASSLFPNAQILSIEPCKEIFECLKANTSSYNNITPLNFAFGYDGYCQIDLDNKFQLSSRFSNKSFGNIKTLSLKSLFSIFNINGNYMIKMDCEGAEEYIVNNKDSEEIIIKSLLTSMEVHFKTTDVKSKEFEKCQSFKDWRFYNDWIYKTFQNTHVLNYYKSNKNRGYGHYSILKK